MHAASSRFGVRPALLLATAVCALLALGCKTQVLHDLPEGEANRILAVLQQHGVMAEKVLFDPDENTWAISVSREATGRAWAILEEYKLPRAAERRFQDVFGQSKLVVTPVEEQALYLEALQGELAQTLEAVDGVIDARVHLVLPQVDLAGQARTGAKASVMVEFQPGPQGTPPLQRPEIQQIVANGVEGLDPASVAVVLKPLSIAAPDTAGQQIDLVQSAGLVLERSSVVRFKLYVAIAALALAVLGFFLFLEGRTNSRLRTAVEQRDREIRHLQRSASPPAQRAS